jgi:hypothetical protein
MDPSTKTTENKGPTIKGPMSKTTKVAKTSGSTIQDPALMKSKGKKKSKKGPAKSNKVGKDEVSLKEDANLRTRANNSELQRELKAAISSKKHARLNIPVMEQKSSARKSSGELPKPALLEHTVDQNREPIHALERNKAGLTPNEASASTQGNLDGDGMTAAEVIPTSEEVARNQTIEDAQRAVSMNSERREMDDLEQCLGWTRHCVPEAELHCASFISKISFQRLASQLDKGCPLGTRQSPRITRGTWSSFPRMAS